jgi:hypothetical protein
MKTVVLFPLGLLALLAREVAATPDFSQWAPPGPGDGISHYLRALMRLRIYTDDMIQYSAITVPGPELFSQPWHPAPKWQGNDHLSPHRRP